MPKIVPGKTLDIQRRAKRETFLKALEVTQGLVYIAAAKCHLDPRVHYTAIEENDEQYIARYKAICERKLDDAEAQLSKAIKAGRDIPLMFYLKCKGKERGYVERQEIAPVTPDGAALVPESLVEVTLKKLMEAERARLAALPEEGA